MEKIRLGLKAKERGYANKTILLSLLIATLMRQSLESTARFLKEIGAEIAISADNILKIIKRMTLDAIENMINSMLRDMIKAS